LVRLCLAQHVNERELVQQIRLVQRQAAAEVGDPLEIFRARPANDPMHLVALLEQQVRQMAAILAGDAGDQRLLHESPRTGNYGLNNTAGGDFGQERLELRRMSFNAGCQKNCCSSRTLAFNCCRLDMRDAGANRCRSNSECWACGTPMRRGLCARLPSIPKNSRSSAFTTQSPR